LSDHADRFTALIDTDVLVGFLARDILLNLAEAGFFRLALSTTSLHDEFPRAFQNAKGTDKTEAGERVRVAIATAFDDALVEPDPGLIAALVMRDPDDRHIVAAAIQAKANVIVTWNVKDFEAHVLAPYGIDVLTPDDFITDTIGLYELDACAVLQRMRLDFRKPAMDADAFLISMERARLIDTAALLYPFKGAI
jgi:predicted nucleic acid-binding protein